MNDPRYTDFGESVSLLDHVNTLHVLSSPLLKTVIIYKDYF